MILIKQDKHVSNKAGHVLHTRYHWSALLLQLAQKFQKNSAENFISYV